jgi:uncharacterized cupin superfamily protein
MSEIIITHPSKDELDKLGIAKWSSWDCDPSEFDWQYPNKETAYVFKGKVVVTSADESKVEIGPGDLVIFPKGLKCHWKVIERIEKVYKMG